MPIYQLDDAIDISPETLLMTDLITTRFRQAGFVARDLTGLRFRVADTPEDVEAEDLARPTLRAVKFEGSHLLDSPTACALATKDGRPLVDVTLSLQSQPRADGEVGRFPVRVTFLRDHVAVMTGFGTVPSLSKEVHEEVVNTVHEMLQSGYADKIALAQLIDRMRRRADATSEDLVADMFGDDYEEERLQGH